MATLLTYSTVDLTLTAGTYFIEFDVNMNGKNLTFDCSSGPIIIKRKGDYAFAQLGAVNTTNSTSTNKVIWTVFSDDTVGDTHPDSTGTPVKAGLELQSMATVADGYTLKSNCTGENWEIRYALNKRLVYHTAGTVSWTNIAFKNCTYDAFGAGVFYLNGTGTATINHISYDDTNSIYGTFSAGNFIVSTTYTTAIDYIYIYDARSNANTDAQIYITANSTTNFSYINIKNSYNSYGVYWVSANAIDVTFSHCNSLFYFQGNNTTSAQKTAYLKNCIFKAGRGPQYQKCIGSYLYRVDVLNCIATDTQYFYTGHASNQSLKTRNCIFNEIDAMLSTGPASQDNNYNGYYNTSETGWTRGANDFTANPEFGAIVDGSVLDTSNAPYDLPTGYVATNAAYKLSGSDTYDNLSIDESIYSPDGYAHTGSQPVNPGIYYKFTTLVSSGITGTGDLTLPKPLLVAEAYLIHIATSAIVLPLPSLQATGVKVLTAEADLVLPQIELASEGYLTHSGTSSITLPSLLVASDGVYVRSGTASLLLPTLQLSASGYFISGTASLALPKLTLQASGIKATAGSASVTLPLLTLQATGVKVLSGTSSISLPLPVVASSGNKIDIYGTSEINLPLLTISSSGIKIVSGTGSLTLPKLTLQASGIEWHIGTAPIVLPKLRLVSSGYRNRIGSSAITLPKLTLQASGARVRIGTVAITLPVVSLVCSAFKYDEIGTASLTLPKLSLQAVGLIANMGTIAITLPKLRLQASGIQLHFGTAPIELPSIRVAVVGHRNRIGTSAIVLPSIILAGKGNRVRIGTAKLSLPLLVFSATLYKYNSGVELDLYTALKKQLQEDIELNLVIHTWIFDNKRRIMQQGDYPSLQLIAKGIVDEKFIGYPMNKLVTEEFEVKARISKSDDPETYAVRLGENIKDAFERDINVGTTASMLYVGDAIITAQSDDIRIIRIPIKAVTRKFYAPTERN